MAGSRHHVNGTLSLGEGVMLTEPKGQPELPGFACVQLIGTGATSRVYRAQRGSDGRPFALKRLTRHLVRSTEALARLKRSHQPLFSEGREQEYEYFWKGLGSGRSSKD